MINHNKYAMLDPRELTMYWKDTKVDNIKQCSKCGKESIADANRSYFDYNYCPYCGRKALSTLTKSGERSKENEKT